MNFFVAALACMVAVSSAHPLAAWAGYGLGYGHGHGAWAHGGAPIGHDGRVVDTPEVAHAKAAHFAAKAAAAHGSWSDGAWAHNGLAHEGWAHNGWAHNDWANNGWAHGSWAHGGAPLGHDGRVVDTPEVAHAKAAHFAAKANAAHGAHHDGQWNDWAHHW